MVKIEVEVFARGVSEDLDFCDKSYFIPNIRLAGLGKEFYAQERQHQEYCSDDQEQAK